MLIKIADSPDLIKLSALTRRAAPAGDRAELREHALTSSSRALDARPGTPPDADRGANWRGRGAYPPVIFSSRKSGCCSRTNSTAKPSSIWRTTRLGVLPMVMRAPMSGRWSAFDRRARLRDVDDAAGQIDAVGQDEPRHRVARGDAAVAAILRQAEDAAVGEPGELGGELVALARRRRDRHGEAVLELARDDAFQPSDMIHIGDDALARLAGDRRDQSHPAGRHIDDLAGKLAPIRQHVAPEQIDLHALESPAFLAQRQDQVLLLR